MFGIKTNISLIAFFMPVKQMFLTRLS